MPELPDIEVYRRNLAPIVVGKKVMGAWVHKEKRTPPEANLQAALIGATLTSIDRDGKAMRFVFDNGSVLVVHLMLNGEYHIGKTQEHLGAKRVSILFDGAGYMAVSDFMGLATIKLNEPASKVPDALDPRFDLETLKKAIAKHPAEAIKSLLIDQHVVQGIGNKYSDEILWLAKIAPQSSAGNVPDDAVERIFKAIKSVLPKAVEIVHAAHPDAIAGKMRDGLKIHRQEKSPSGNPVTVLEVGGRKAHYCPEEQVLYE